MVLKSVLNKELVYSDELLPISDSNNMKVSKVFNVSKYSLETCIKKIIESNPDVEFHTVQYSQNDQIVYFYANNLVNTNLWDERNKKDSIRFKSGNEIVDEISNILSQDVNEDSDCISLYDVSNYFKKFNNKNEYTKRKYNDYFDKKLNNVFNNSSFVVYDFDYDKKVLRTGFKYFDSYKVITFGKNDGDFYVIDSDTTHSKDVLMLIGNELSKLYDELMNQHDFMNQFFDRIKLFNSNFYARFSKYGVTIITLGKINEFIDGFEFSSYSYMDKYKCDCNSILVLNAVDGKEEEIFKKLFVRIDDCPEWCKDELYQIRQEELEEKNKIDEIETNEDELYPEDNTKKTLSLKKRISSWFKK